MTSISINSDQHLPDTSVTRKPLLRLREDDQLPTSLSKASRNCCGRLQSNGSCCGWEPSGGTWGFMVVFASFAVHALLGGFNRCFGIIYLQLQLRFDSLAAITAAVGGLTTALRLGAAPVGTAMTERFGEHVTVVTGGLILGLGAILTAFVPDTWYALFTLGCMSGIGGALVYIPSLVIVSQYFTKGRATALGVACSGSGIGVFVWPLVMQNLFSHYGYTGGMVLVGALLLNTMVSGCLYRPVSVNVNKGGRHSGNKRHVAMTNAADDDGGSRQQKSPERVQVSPYNDEEAKEDEDDGGEGGGGGGGGEREGRRTGRGGIAVQRRENMNKKQQENNGNRLAFSSLARRIHLDLLTNTPYLSYFIAQMFCSACYWTAQVLLPALLVSAGHNSEVVLFVLLLMGAVDIVGRLGGGALFDVPWVRRRQRTGYAILQALTALVTLAWPFTVTSVGLFAACVGLQALFGGAVVSLKALIAGNLVGTQLLVGGLGLAIFAQGLGVMTAPPLAGLLRDVTGDYTWSYVFLALLGMLGSVVFYVGAVFPTCRKQCVSETSVNSLHC